MKKDIIIGWIILATIVCIIIAPFIYLELIREDTTQLAKDEFSKYFNGKEEVVYYGTLLLRWMSPFRARS